MCVGTGHCGRRDVDVDIDMCPSAAPRVGKKKKLTKRKEKKKKSRRLEEAQASTGKHKKGALVMVADPPAEQGQSVSHSITHSLLV